MTIIIKTYFQIFYYFTYIIFNFIDYILINYSKEKIIYSLEYIFKRLKSFYWLYSILIKSKECLIYTDSNHLSISRKIKFMNILTLFKIILTLNNQFLTLTMNQ